MFEELVGSNACYADQLGRVETHEGGLRVWANAAGGSSSNHVIGARRAFARGQTGVWEYAVSVQLPAETAVTRGQTGPEFSVQSTREIAPGTYRTHIAGIQYRRRPEDWTRWEWAVWDDARWVSFLDQPLQGNTWYRMVMRADLTTNRYVRFDLSGGGLSVSTDLSQHRIRPEEKFGEEALWITLESENLWSNCQAVYTFPLLYDDVDLAEL